MQITKLQLNPQFFINLAFFSLVSISALPAWSNPVAAPTTPPASPSTLKTVTQPLMVAGQVVTPQAGTTAQPALITTNGAAVINAVPNIKAEAANLNPLLVQQQDAKLLERVTQLEKNNQDILTQNQDLELKKENLEMQVKLLQGEQGTQLFIYGALVFAAGIVAGILLFQWLAPKPKRW